MLRTTINFVNNEGKFDFASDFTIEFNQNELRFNYGCIGHFGKDLIYYIERTKLMSKLFDKWEELETKYLEKLNNKTFKEYFDLDYELDKYERYLKENEKIEAYNKTLETIKPGQTYYLGKGNDIWGTIIKVTPKRVYYKLYWKNWIGKMVYNGEKFENQKHLVESIQETRYRLKGDKDLVFFF